MPNILERLNLPFIHFLLQLCPKSNNDSIQETEFGFLKSLRASLKKAKRGKYENQEQLITQKTGHNHEYCLILDVLSS